MSIKALRGWFRFEAEAGDKYKLLGVVKGVLKLLAWLFIIAGAIFSLIILIFGGTPDAPRASFIVILFFSLIEFIFLFTAAELINILVNIESNTKKTARLLGAREEK